MTFSSSWENLECNVVVLHGWLSIHLSWVGSIIFLSPTLTLGVRGSIEFTIVCPSVCLSVHQINFVPFICIWSMADIFPINTSVRLWYLRLMLHKDNLMYVTLFYKDNLMYVTPLGFSKFLFLVLEFHMPYICIVWHYILESKLISYPCLTNQSCKGNTLHDWDVMKFMFRAEIKLSVRIFESIGILVTVLRIPLITVKPLINAHPPKIGLPEMVIFHI